MPTTCHKPSISTSKPSNSSPNGPKAGFTSAPSITIPTATRMRSRLSRNSRSEERRVGSDWSSDVCSSDLYQQALQLKPEWSEGWFYLGTLYYDSDRYADAQPAFAQFVKLADKPAGWAFLGLCEFETGDYTLAREHMQQALDGGLAPEIEQVVRFHQALLLTRLGLFEQALHWYKSLVRRGIHDPTLVAGLGLNSLDKPMLPKETPPAQREFIAAVGRTAHAWMSGDNAKTEAAFHGLLEAYPDRK